MYGILVAIALLALSAWEVLATFRRLHRIHAGRGWWAAFAVLVIVGLSAGSWLVCSFEYQVSPRFRFISFPIPLAFFHLENGRWIDFITPAYVMYPGLVANVVSVVAIALLPLLIASLAFGKSPREHGNTPPNVQPARHP